MGLDQFAYSVDAKGKREEIAYWRKHPNLQGWMEALWIEKGYPYVILPNDPTAVYNNTPLPANAAVVMFEPNTATKNLRVYESDENDGANFIVAELPDGEALAAAQEKEKQDRVFNTVPLELTAADLDKLETAINSNELPETEGFFFGSNADDEYKQDDLDFIDTARTALKTGKRVFYDSWW